jgi:hypothetical protein
MHIFRRNQLSRQTGSRNLTGPKTLPTIWHTYMKLVTKYQIPVVNSCWEKCDEKFAYMFNVYKTIHIEHICTFFVTFFSATIDGRDLIFGHKLHIGTPYCGKPFWTHQIPTSCLPTLLIFMHIEHICSFFVAFFSATIDGTNLIFGCAYMFNVYKNQQSRQTGSRNLMGPKTLPTIWGYGVPIYQQLLRKISWTDRRTDGRTDRQR